MSNTVITPKSVRVCVWADDRWDALSTVLRSQSETSGRADGDDTHGGSSHSISYNINSSFRLLRDNLNTTLKCGEGSACADTEIFFPLNLCTCMWWMTLLIISFHL